jgi:predicted nucleic acid-binding Zn ribbon protein
MGWASVSFPLATPADAANFSGMAVYVYETIPDREGGTVRTYEIRQSMKDTALTTHPETGEPIRRVITGGLGIMTSSKGGPAPRPASGGACCGGGCGCH